MRRALLLVVAGCGHLLEAPDRPEPSTDPIVLSHDAGVDTGTEKKAANGGVVLASSVDDFSGTQGEKGWTYGHVDPSTSPSFRPMTHFDGTAWTLPGATWLAIDASGGAPDGAGIERWPVRRWTSTAAGSVEITLRLYKLETSCGNGLDGRLFVDGIERWARFVAFGDGAGVTETVHADVAIGSTVDLAVDPHLGDQNCDRAFFSAVIRLH